jgi:uncharacterized protein with PQ loop repeat
MGSVSQEAEANQLSKIKNRSLFDRFMLLVAVIEPLSTLPQIYEIWIKGQTVGVSATTWFLYSLAEALWLVYGIKQRDRAIIVASALWAIMELLVAAGAFLK